MKLFFRAVLVLCLSAGFFGCNTVGKVMAPNNQVLTYNLPYDLTYLRTLDALNALDNWQLDETDMAKGLISVRNTNYSRLDDSDLRVVKFQVERVNQGTTSVSILPKSQHVYGGDKLLKAIGDRLDQETQDQAPIPDMVQAASQT